MPGKSYKSLISENRHRLFFSIIIPVYNREDVILDTIKSVFYQTYPEFEIIVVDDGSTDNTAGVIKLINDDRLKYFCKKNEERGAARNFGINKARGDYITFLDSDDLLYSNHLFKAKDIINKNNFPEVFHLGYEVRDRGGNVLRKVNRRKGNLNRQLLKGNQLSCAGVFLKKDIAKEHQFNEVRKLAGTEDWELWLRLAVRYQFCYSNVITSCLVHHENRSVTTLNEKKVLDTIAALEESLKADPVFMKTWPEKLKIIKGHMYTYLALNHAINKNKGRALYHLYKGIFLSPSEIKNRRTLAIIKKLFS